MLVEVSNGELVDKITILKIKMEKFSDANKLENVKKEYQILSNVLSEIGFNEENELFLDLIKVNKSLWEIEDKIRIKESKSEFDEVFIKLARSVYYENDKRFEIKKKINDVTKSNLQEEKDYVKYK